jgi:NADH:ubiquinone oxidoreductase subunit
MAVLRFFFVWWRNATVGTRVMTWLSGQYVGTDKFGNRYYQTRNGVRRWVIYNGTVEASRVPPEWHGWIHHMVAAPPTPNPPRPKSWEREHLPNMTGTPGALRPQGSLAARGVRPAATGDYEAWTPD